MVKKLLGRDGTTKFQDDAPKNTSWKKAKCQYSLLVAIEWAFAGVV